MISHRTLQRLK